MIIEDAISLREYSSHPPELGEQVWESSVVMTNRQSRCVHGSDPPPGRCGKAPAHHCMAFTSPKPTTQHQKSAPIATAVNHLLTSRPPYDLASGATSRPRHTNDNDGDS